MLRDTLGVPHVFAKSDHDAYFMVGYLHAQDRLFQMDSSRRQASGTLAELLGPSARERRQPRTLGLRRGAALAGGDLAQSRATLEAYADGVNAWLSANPLPSEYAALELTKANVQPWTMLDSLAVAKSCRSASRSRPTTSRTRSGWSPTRQQAPRSASTDGSCSSRT